MTTRSVTTHSPEETRAFGRKLGMSLRGREVILLVGDLGAGKTTLTQGIAEGLDIHEYTKSPTFVLVHEYKGRLPLYHIDLYRIEGDLEAWALGVDEYLEDVGVSVIEWADRAPKVFPDDYLLIRLERLSDTDRRLQLESHGPRAGTLLSTVQGGTLGA